MNLSKRNKERMRLGLCRKKIISNTALACRNKNCFDGFPECSLFFAAAFVILSFGIFTCRLCVAFYHLLLFLLSLREGKFPDSASCFAEIAFVR